MPAIHVEFTEYYFPDGKDYPSKTFVPWYSGYIYFLTSQINELIVRCVNNMVGFLSPITLSSPFSPIGELWG